MRPTSPPSPAWLSPPTSADAVGWQQSPGRGGCAGP